MKKTAEFTGLSHDIVNNIYCKLRIRIAEPCVAESTFTNGEAELDESYFGARYVRGIRGRGAKSKISVFGMLKRGDKIIANLFFWGLYSPVVE